MGLTGRWIVASILAAVLLPGAAAGQGSAGPAPGESLGDSYRRSQDNVAYQKVPPVRVFDNLYYVGPGFVSVWLIPTTDGLILIDSAQEPYVDHVLEGIRMSGFDPKDVKYILLSHGHLDHFGGATRIKQLSGARVAALEPDWQLMAAAAARATRNGQQAPVPARDLVLRDGETITLGTTSLTVYHTPGHTAGTASFAFTVFDNGRAYKAFSFGGPGPRNGVDGYTQFVDSIRRIRRELADVDVPVHIHSALLAYPYPGGTIFERLNTLARRQPGDPHPMVDNATWRQWLSTAEAAATRQLEAAKTKPQGS